jgi:hypothetical protein
MLPENAQPWGLTFSSKSLLFLDACPEMRLQKPLLLGPKFGSLYAKPRLCHPWIRPRSDVVSIGADILIVEADVRYAPG